MTSGRVRATTPADVWAVLTSLRARSIIFDGEPLVASWDTDQATLTDGIGTVLAAVAGAAPDAVLFATNSSRRPATAPAAG
jgi:hypothetical protein